MLSGGHSVRPNSRGVPRTLGYLLQTWWLAACENIIINALARVTPESHKSGCNAPLSSWLNQVFRLIHSLRSRSLALLRHFSPHLPGLFRRLYGDFLRLLSGLLPNFPRVFSRFFPG